MSALLLPPLPGLKVEVERTQAPTTTVYTTVSNKEQRVHWGPQRRTYSLNFEFLRSDAIVTVGWASGSSELAAVLSLHQQVSGSWDSWLLTDPMDGSQVRVRFADDSLALTQIFSGTWGGKVKAIEVL